jgi:hypothetical protein
MQLVFRLLALGALFAVSAAAQAEWLKATSRHFIVYSETGEAALRKQASELEYFDAMIRRFHRVDADPDAEFNRVTVYVLPSIGAVQKLSGMKNVAGFYVPRVDGSVAFTPRQGGHEANDLTPKIVLFHEYAHHFLLGSYASAYPAWFSEGYAEFASTMMQRDGAFWLGAAANHRGYGLLFDKALSIRQLFEPPARMNAAQREAIYGRGWLLTHYLMFDPDRRGQLRQYLSLFNAGKPSLAAATEAFGDLKVLDSKLERYLGRNKLPAIKVETSSLAQPEVAVRKLTPGESALIAMRMESTRGVNQKTAASLYARARAAAAPFAGDAVAQGWLAEMAFDAGQLDAAEAAADAAISVDPTSSQALLYKARVHLSRAAEARATDPKVWTAARSWIVKANRASPNDAAALALFYQSFLMQKAKPSKSAVAGLYRTVVLVPQDGGMRFLAARQMILDGDAARAKLLLRPLASDPHAGADNGAARLLALLDAGHSGQGAIDALEQAAKKGAEAGAAPPAN